MKDYNLIEFRNDEDALAYLKALPRYGNTTMKSLLYRALFFWDLLFCRLFKRYKPLFVVLVTNNGCNLNCRYCYGSYGERRLVDFSTKELLKIIGDLKKLGTRLLTIHGGESLLRKDIGEILNYAKLKGFYISFNTNGYLVPSRIKDLKCVDTVCLSLDGSEESNDRNRGKGCYKKVLEAIEALKKEHVPIVISATLTKDNINDMEFLAELARSKNARVQYSILYNYLDLKDKYANIVMSDIEIRKIVKKIFGLKKMGYPVYYSTNVLKTSINWPVAYEEKYFVTEYDGFTQSHGDNIIPCYHGRLKYQIDADGRVVTCWAHNYQNAPNIKELGVAKAIEECRKRSICRYCSFLANNEHNALMHLSPRNIWDIFCIHFADALKIRSLK